VIENEMEGATMATQAKATKTVYRPRITMSPVYGIYFVESESKPGRCFRTDAILGKCSCPARKPCKHIVLAVKTWELHRRLRLAARQASEKAAGAFPVAA